MTSKTKSIGYRRLTAEMINGIKDTRPVSRPDGAGQPPGKGGGRAEAAMTVKPVKTH
jgi:hypothetical protein